MYISFLQRSVLAAQSPKRQPRSQAFEGVPASGGQIAIAARHIRMEYATHARRESVLNDINLTLAAGQVHLLMGPSGSGKTTLLSILGGILTPTAGEVDLLGCCITRLTPAQRSQFRLQNLGFVFQGFNLFPALTAAENIEMVLGLLAMEGDEAKAQALELLDLVGIAHKAHCLPEDLSGGQKQRVAIARALAHRPKIILADEPTAALDRDSGATVMQLLKQLATQAGATVLIVTHDPRIQSAADRVIYLEDGHLR
jgi:putative ABC transport system ATP-binding protein